MCDQNKVSGSWNEVVRIDLEAGEFRSTIQMEAMEETLEWTAERSNVRIKAEKDCPLDA